MNNEFINRREPTVNVGLTAPEVEERKQAGFVNRNISIKNNRFLSIIIGNFLNIHIVLTLVILGFSIASKYWFSLFFLLFFVIEIVMKILIITRSFNKPKSKEQNKHSVIRDGAEVEVDTSSIVLDDIIRLKDKDLVPVDGVIKEGDLVVDESSLFGSSGVRIKKAGDTVYYGTTVISGNAYIKCVNFKRDSVRAKTILAKRKQKTNRLNILLFLLTIIISLVVIGLSIAYIINLTSNGKDFNSITQLILLIAITSIPFGIYAFIPLTAFISNERLKKMNARVINLCSLETLSRVDTICFDKTGVLTNDDFEVKKVLLYGNGYTMDEIEQIISNLLETNKDNDLVAQALHRSFNYSLTKRAKTALPFNEVNKYSGATFTGDETYAIGYPTFLNITNRSALNHRTDEYIKQGCDVVVLAKCSSPVKDGKINGEMLPIAIIVLQRRIIKNISQMIFELKSEGKNIKLISGDDPKIVIQVATECGIEENNKFISLKDMADEEVIKAATEFDVFGFASAEQKELIIKTLRKNKKVVAMIGDGDNDVLAFKASDISICVNNGSDSAYKNADILLTESNVETIPALISEGEKATYNIQRIISIFLSKGMTSLVFALAFLIMSYTMKISYPFVINNFYLIEFVAFLGGLLICFDKAKKPMHGHLVRGILRKVIPAVLVCGITLGIYVVLMVLQQNLIFYTGVYTIEAAATLGIISFSILIIAILFKCYTRFELYSLISFIVVSVIFAGLSTAAIIVSYKVGINSSVLLIDFPSLTIVNYFAFAIVIILIASFYLLVSYIIEVFKGEHLNVKSKPGSSKSH